MNHGVGVRILLLVSLQDLVQVVEGLGSLEAVGFQEVGTQDQAAAVLERLVQGGHDVALAVGQLQVVDLIGQAELLSSSVEVGGPLGVVGDSNDTAVHAQGSLGTVDFLEHDDVGAVFLGIQSQVDGGAVVALGDSLDGNLGVSQLSSLLQCQPVSLEGSGGRVGVVDGDLDGIGLGSLGGLDRIVVFYCGSSGGFGLSSLLAGSQTKNHDQSQQQSQSLLEHFHFLLEFCRLLAFRNGLKFM